MRRVHLLRVESEPQAFAPLLLAAGAAGLRLGWLELAAPPALPEPLRAALLAGSARAVAVADAWTLAARPRRGPARLRELVRQQYLGCAAVLVRGDVDAPLLSPAADGSWVVSAGAEAAGGGGAPAAAPEATFEGPPGGAAASDPAAAGSRRERRLDTSQLVAALRQPRPFPPAAPLT